MGGGFQGKTIVDVRGRWALEQLGPIDLCCFEAELAATLGGSLREGLRLILAYLGEETEDGEGPWQKAERMLRSLDGGGDQLIGSLMDRDILQDAERISGTLVEMLQAVSIREVRRIAEKLLVARDGFKGGLRVAIAPGQPPSVAVGSTEQLEALLADDPHEFWKLLLWGLEVNLRPLIAALGTRLRSRSSERGESKAQDQHPMSGAPTQSGPGRSTS